jgi:hypothetical protein
MRRTRLLLLALCLALLAFFAPSAGVLADSDGWEVVAEGVAYKEFRLPGPNRAFVARMDRNVRDLIIESSIAQGRLSGGKEIVSEMAERYDQALNTWGGDWGPRNDVIVAINGSYHDPQSGIPYGGTIHSGWYAKRYDDLGGYSGFIWKRNRAAFMGGCITHDPQQQVVQNLTSGSTIYITSINATEGRSALYTTQYDGFTPDFQSGRQVLVQVTAPIGIDTDASIGRGIVREIDSHRNPVAIPFDHIIISTRGESARIIKDTYQVGDILGFSAFVRNYENDCDKAEKENNFGQAYAGIGGNYVFLRDGELQEITDANAQQKHPRSAICFNEDFIYFVVVDGRRDSYSKGMDIDELAVFCKDKLDSTDGGNQDGGGSSALWVDGEIKNRPSDGNERAVANGLMMVRVEPSEESRRFQVLDAVRTRNPSNVHVGPGTNYAAITSVPEGASGVIQPHLNSLNGILAKGAYWWYVKLDGATGWINEDALELVSRPTSFNPSLLQGQVTSYSPDTPAAAQ